MDGSVSEREVWRIKSCPLLIQSPFALTLNADHMDLAWNGVVSMKIRLDHVEFSAGPCLFYILSFPWP